MRPNTGAPAGSKRAARRKKWIGAIAGTALAATTMVVFNPAPESAFASTDPGGPLMYVSSPEPGTTVTAFSLNTGKAVATIPTSGVAYDLAFSPDASTVYATESSGHLAVISVATNTITASIPVGASPEGLAVSPDGAAVYVANDASDTVSVIKTGTDTVTATIPVGSSPHGIAVSPDGAAVYVVDTAGATVSVISTATDAVTGTISLTVGSWPEYVAFTPNGATAYVTDDGNGTVSAIDTGTEAVTATIPVGEGPFGLAVTPDGGAVYVANTYTVSAISTATNTVTGTITTVGNPAEVAAAPDGGAVYLSSTDAGGVSVIGTESNTINGVFPAAPSWGLAVSPDPEVTAVTPDGGPPAGGNQVTLTGVGFEDVLGVTFGGAEATSYTVASPTTITATVPAGRPGPVYAFVTTIRGSSSTTAGSEYTYQSVPTITGVSPDYGPAAGGRPVTITGTGLSGPVTVKFGTKVATVYSQSPTQLQVLVPAGTVGTTANITISTSAGTSAFTSLDEYSYIRSLRNPIPLTKNLGM